MRDLWNATVAFFTLLGVLAVVAVLPFIMAIVIMGIVIVVGFVGIRAYVEYKRDMR